MKEIKMKTQEDNLHPEEGEETIENSFSEKGS